MSFASFGNESSSVHLYSRTVSNGAGNGTTRNGHIGNAAAAATAVFPSLPEQPVQQQVVQPGQVLDSGGKVLDPEDFLKAYDLKAEEFDEDGPDVLFVKNVKLNNPDELVTYCARGVVLVRNSGTSLWDAWIRKVPNRGHEGAVTEFGRQMGNYAKAMNSKSDPRLAARGGHMKVAAITLVNGEVLPEKRIDPDQALNVVVEDDDQPRVIVEVELSNRGPLKLAQHVHELMRNWGHLRCVIGLKIYKRSQVAGEFACVCFVWKKRQHDDTIYVERVFDVGPRASNMHSIEDVAKFWCQENVDFHTVSTENDKSFKVTVVSSGILAYPLPDDCPDELEDHFTISVDKADVYHGHTPTMKQRTKKPKYVKVLEDDANLKINLFDILVEIDTVKTVDFK